MDWQSRIGFATNHLSPEMIDFRANILILRVRKIYAAQAAGN
jgi:hypothetical protein